MNRKAIIFGIKGQKLTSKERIFFRRVKPWGIILFSRNIKNILQIKKLISDIKKIFKDKHYPILIDQEGGDVSRLNNIIDLRLFSQNYFAEIYKRDRKLSKIIYKIYVDKVCEIFKKVGLNINITPVLDVRRKNDHSIISNRSFSENPNDVINLGKLCIDLFRKNKIATVIKHIPGHGLAKDDSHLKMPIVNVNKKELIKLANKNDISIEDHLNPGKIIDKLFGELVEPKLINPTFVLDYPKLISPLAKQKRDSDLEIVERFELFIGGMEFANSFSELNDPEEQRNRLKEIIKSTSKIDKEIQVIDEDFLLAMEAGMPPMGGVGMGVDRLVMLLTGQDSIKDVIFFPILRS